MDALPALWLIVATFLVAGTVKGIAGVGLPMTALGVLTFQTDPRTAIALAMVPIFLSNLWQFLRAGSPLAAIRRYLSFLIVMLIGIPVTLALTADVSQQVLLATLGSMFLLFVTLNLTRWAPRIPDHADLPAQIGLGAASGVLGGLTSIWLPPIVVYLAARQTAKEEFVRATGLLLFSGSIPLFAGYVREGFLTGPLAALSAGLVVPTVAGMFAGERLRRKLSEPTFRKILLLVFALIGLNLIRRAIMS